MLRFIAPKSSTTTAATASVVAATAFLAAATRNIAVYSPQSELLVKHAKYKGFASPASVVWFELDDMWWLNKAGHKLKNVTEEPITVQIARRIELFNTDQLTAAPEDATSPAEKHSSLRSKQPYGKTFQSELDAKAQALGFKSTWWLTDREIRKRGLQLRQGSNRPVAIIAKAPGKLFNAEQFEQPTAVARIPISGLSKKMFGTDMSEPLSAHIAAKGYPTGLFFTTKQLELFELTNLVKPGEAAFACPLFNWSNKAGNNSNNDAGDVTFYNLTQIENSDEVMRSVGRYPVDVPTYFTSGKPMGDSIAEKAREFAAKNKAAFGGCNYFIDSRDVERRGLKLIAGAQGFTRPSFGQSITGGNSNTKTVDLYNVDQLTDPAQGMRVAGTKV